MRRALSARMPRRASTAACSALVAGIRRISRREDRQHAVADELQHLAAMLLDRRRHDVEIVVEPGR